MRVTAGEPYDRPDQAWVCGRTSAPCSRGPTPDGVCGGNCDGAQDGDGAMVPCVPRLSHKALRRRHSLWWVVLALGLVALFLGGDLAVRAISPGPLRAAHAGLTDCRTCHAEPGESGFANWVKAALADTDVHAANGRCLDCHVDGDDGQAGQAARQAAHGPHGRPWPEAPTSAAPAASLRTAALASLADAVFDAPMNGEPLACAACHAEHRGSTAPPPEVAAGKACRLCHPSVGSRFPDQHPDLGTYPFSRRTSLIFDHAAHLDRHFPERKRAGDLVPSGCLSCHAPDDAGRFMTVFSYEETCASCHAGDIREASRSTGPKGVDVLTVPGLDVRSLQEHGVAIGGWPAYADAAPSDGLALLLADDAEASNALRRLRSVDLLDLRDAEAETLDAVETLAWAVKGVVHRLLNEGPQAAFGAINGNAAETLPPDVALGLQQAWFPDLSAEVAAHMAGEAVPTREVGIPSETPSAPAADPGGSATDLDAGGGILGHGAGILGDGDDILGGGGDILGGGIGDMDLSSIPGPSAGDATAPAPRAVDEPDRWGGGGWRRAAFSLRYRAVSHADPLMVALHDAAAAGGDAALFQALVTQAPGGCVDCHAVDQEEGSAPTVAWSATPRGVWPQTKFHHATHFTAAVQDGCATCHTIRSGDAYARSFAGRSIADAATGFQPVDEETCASCHAREEALADCTSCHAYHGTPLTRRMPR